MEIGLKIGCRVKVCIVMLMVLCLKVILKITNIMVRENSFLLMELCIKGNGKMG